MLIMKMKQIFKKYAIKEKETEFFKIYTIGYCDKKYRVYLLKKKVNSQTVIHCEGNCLYYEQRPLFWHLSGRMYGNKVPFFNDNNKKGVETIVVIKGCPDGIVGIDDGVFSSYRNYNSERINVMIKKHFYCLEA